MSTTQKRLLTPKEVEEQYGFPVRLLERWRMVGGGPQYIKAGRRRLYTPEDLEAYIDSRRVSNTAEAKQRAL